MVIKKNAHISSFSILIIYTLISFQFYQYVNFSNTLLKLPIFVCTFLLLIYVARHLFLVNSKSVYYRLMQYICWSTLLSMLMSYFIWDQSLILSYRASVSLLVILFFFFLYNLRLPLKYLEYYIWTLGFLYILLWLYAFKNLPYVTFGFKDDVLITDESRGMLRINFIGRISLIFAYFMAISKFFNSTKNNKLYLFLAIFLYVFVIFQLTRQLILWTAVITFYFIYKKYKQKVFLFVSVLFCLFYLLTSSLIKLNDDTVVGKMLLLTEKQNEDDKYDENIRLKEYKYFIEHYSSNVFQIIFGNGYPHSDSHYGKRQVKEQSLYDFYLSDVGYAMMYVVTGLLGVFLYLVLFAKSAFTKIPKKYEYVNMFMLFMIPANLTASWYATPDCAVSISVCVYIIFINKKKSSEENIYEYKL